MFSKRLDIEKQRAESAERLLQVAEAQLARVVESTRAIQTNAKFERERLDRRIAELEAAMLASARAAPASDPKEREELLVLRERTRNLEDRARLADRVPVLEKEALSQRARADALESELATVVTNVHEMEVAVALLSRHASALERFGARAGLAPLGATPREALARAAERYGDLVLTLERGQLGAPRQTFTDAEAIEFYVKHVCGSADLAAQRTALSEQARLWIEDPKFKVYHVELLYPFAAAIQEALARPDANVEGARCALRIVQEAQRQASGHLLRRCATLDGANVRAKLSLDRYNQDPAHALERMTATLAQVRGIGSVDFLHNVALGAYNAVRERQPGAAWAAWLTSDVALAVANDKRVRAWMAQTTT